MNVARRQPSLHHLRPTTTAACARRSASDSRQPRPASGDWASSDPGHVQCAARIQGPLAHHAQRHVHVLRSTGATRAGGIQGSGNAAPAGTDSEATRAAAEGCFQEQAAMIIRGRRGCGRRAFGAAWGQPVGFASRQGKCHLSHRPRSLLDKLRSWLSDIKRDTRTCEFIDSKFANGCSLSDSHFATRGRIVI